MYKEGTRYFFEKPCFGYRYSIINESGRIAVYRLGKGGRHEHCFDLTFLEFSSLSEEFGLIHSTDPLPLHVRAELLAMQHQVSDVYVAEGLILEPPEEPGERCKRAFQNLSRVVEELTQKGATFSKVAWGENYILRVNHPSYIGRFAVFDSDCEDPVSEAELLYNNLANINKELDLKLSALISYMQLSFMGGVNYGKLPKRPRGCDGSS